MKKPLLILAALSCGLMANAKFVSKNSAQIVAQQFLSQYTDASDVYLKEIVHWGSTDITTMYVFSNTANNGFVIVSADDAVIPVLGYSVEQPFSVADKPVSPEVQYWIKGYSSEIATVIVSQKQATDAIKAKWEKLLNATNNNDGNIANKPTDVQPMLATTWDQWPLYNNLCPVPGANNTSATPTGCVATAMAQIMNYWQNPATGTGTHSYSSSTIGGPLSADFGNTTYDWADMPSALDGSSTPAQVNAIATLMFHCGVSVNMDYNTAVYGGSGALVIKADGYGNNNNTPCSENALKNYFGYKSTIKGYQRGYFKDTTWHNMLKFELDNGRPLLYTGFEGSGGGHAFVFDGYDENEMFHVNWGWSGVSNGYFIVDNLNPSILGAGGGNGNFNYMQEALIMIEPQSSTLPPNPYTPDKNAPDLLYEYQNPQSDVTTILHGASYTNTEHIKESGIDSIKNAYITVIALDTNDVNSYNPNLIALTSTIHSFTPGGVYDYNYTVNNTNMLPVGAYYIIYLYNTDGLQDLIYPQGSNDPNPSLLIVTNDVTGVNTISDDNNFRIYPNPAKDVIHIDLSRADSKLTGYEMINIIGQKIMEGSIDNLTKDISINTSNIPAGNYVLQLNSERGPVNKKITINK